jgi:flagellar biosynthesis protein FlhA
MHLHEVLEKNIWRFMSLQEVHNLIAGLEEHNKILKEKMEKIEDTYLLQKVLISLLKERISIKNFPEIVESFLEIYGRTKDIDIIVALIRQRIAGQIFENYKNEDGKVYMISLGEKEQEIKVVNSDGIFHIEMNMAWQQDFVERLKKEKEVNRLASVDPIILVRRPEVRAALSRMLEAFEIETPVVSVLEIPLNVDNEIVNVL